MATVHDMMLKPLREEMEHEDNLSGDMPDSLILKIRIQTLRQMQHEGKLATPEFQFNAENLLPLLIRKIVKYVSSEYNKQEWHCFLECLYYCCSNNTLAIKYVLGTPDTLKKVVEMMYIAAQSSRHAATDTAIHMNMTGAPLKNQYCCGGQGKGDCSNDKHSHRAKKKTVLNTTHMESVESMSIYWSLKVLNICSMGSKHGDTELWKEIVADLNLTKVITDGGKSLETNETVHGMLAPLVYSLKVLHNCHIDAPTNKFYRTNKKMLESSVVNMDNDYDPVARLQVILTNYSLVYSVFCSSPDCKKRDPTHHSFPHCAKCKLTRYCSPACQRHSWKENQHKFICRKAEDLVAKPRKI